MSAHPVLNCVGLEDSREPNREREEEKQGELTDTDPHTQALVSLPEDVLLHALPLLSEQLKELNPSKEDVTDVQGQPIASWS